MATLNPQQLATANVLGQPVNQQPMGLDRINTTNAAVPTSMATQATTPTPFTTTAVGQPVPQQGAMYNPTQGAASVPLNHLNQILNQENALLRNARTSGLEAAAGRGLQNSSIAAGAAQRAALDYAMPILGHAQDTFNQREQRAWSTDERLGTQNWQSGERALDRTHDFSMQDARQQWQADQNQLDRDWRSGEAQLDRQFTTSEREAMQQWQSNESALSREQQIIIANLQEEFARNQREWTAEQNLLERDWRSSESLLDREFTREEREAVQQWQRDESQLTREQQITMANLQEEMARAQREWTAQQNQLDRDQQLSMAEVQNWLANEAFMRDFNAQLASMPINNTANLLNFISQQAITNPEIYTPEIVSGMSEFFTTNSMDVLSRYFPSYFRNTGGA